MSVQGLSKPSTFPLGVNAGPQCGVGRRGPTPSAAVLESSEGPESPESRWRNRLDHNCDQSGQPGRLSAANQLSTLTWNQALEEGQKEVGRRYLEEVLAKYDGRVADAASHAGVEHESFYRLLRRFGVELDGARGKRGQSRDE